ncbi:MAG: hypothetical protein R3D33_08375 [Hyphomicrobiaceae bacterium]
MSHPIFALWSHPRSMSTATERIMRERGDLACEHEPFMYDYYVHRQVKRMPHFDVEPGRPLSFADIVAHLIDEAESGPVFFKDMAYYVVPQIFARPDLARRFTGIFLIRDPRRSIVSYAKLDPEFSSEEVGLEAEWRLADWVMAETGTRPLVVEAEAIAADPKATIGRLWQRLGLAYEEKAFDWQPANVPKDWQQVAAWHGDASSSTGIRRSAGEGDPEAAFSEAAAARPELRQFLAHHQPFYERLRAFSITGGDRA